MVLVMVMVTMARIAAMVKATGRRRKLEEYGGVRNIIIAHTTRLAPWQARRKNCEAVVFGNISPGSGMT